MITTNKVIEIFSIADDFSKEYEKKKSESSTSRRQRNQEKKTTNANVSKYNN